jgi:hypothetical protein
LLKLGIDVAQSTVAKYMTRRRRPPSPAWPTFLRNQTRHIAAIDLFVVPTNRQVILRLQRRWLIWTNVTTNPTAEWIARQITEAFPWDEAPHYLIRDRDTSYGAAVTRRLRTIGAHDVESGAEHPVELGRDHVSPGRRSRTIAPPRSRAESGFDPDTPRSTKTRGSVTL